MDKTLLQKTKFLYKFGKFYLGDSLVFFVDEVRFLCCKEKLKSI